MNPKNTQNQSTSQQDEISAQTISHTPGPWKTFMVAEVVEVRAIDRERKPIVSWPGFDESDIPLKVHQANAHLIAAAPELLTAVKELLARLDEVDPEKHDSPMRRFARAAIAKAQPEDAPVLVDPADGCPNCNSEDVYKMEHVTHEDWYECDNCGMSFRTLPQEPAQ